MINVRVKSPINTAYELPRMCMNGSKFSCQYGDIKCPFREVLAGGPFVCKYKENRMKKEGIQG